MKNMLTACHSVCAFLCEADPDTLSALTFGTICRRYHADPSVVDCALYDTFGMSGEEIMECFCAGGL